MSGRIDWSQMKTFHESYGKAKFINHTIALINEGVIDENNFSLKKLWEALGCPNILREAAFGEMLTEAEFQENMDSTAFPKITGALINKVVQSAYDLEIGTAMQLVTVVPSSQKDDTVVGFTAADQLQEVQEGMPYPEGEIGEKYHKIRNRKFGRILTLTEEMIKFDQTGQMVQRARNIGENAAAKKEEIIMNGVLENASTGVYAAWRPAGTSTTLYSDTSNDPYTTGTIDNNITDTLADETDLDSAMAKFETFTDEKSTYLGVKPKILLVGYALAAIARKITESTGSNVSNKSAAVINPVRGMITPVISSYVTNKKGAAYWYIGDFKKQFIYTEVFPLGVFQAKPGSTAEFERDNIFRFKARFMGGCGAVSNRYVIQSTGAG